MLDILFINKAAMKSYTTFSIFLVILAYLNTCCAMEYPEKEFKSYTDMVEPAESTTLELPGSWAWLDFASTRTPEKPMSSPRIEESKACSASCVDKHIDTASSDIVSSDIVSSDIVSSCALHHPKHLGTRMCIAMGLLTQHAVRCPWPNCPCMRLFIPGKELSFHIRKEHNPTLNSVTKKFACPHLSDPKNPCKESCTSIVKLIAHLHTEQHRNLKPLWCTLCHKTFCSTEEGTTHINSHHKTSGIYTCFCSNYRFKSYADWLNHILWCTLHKTRIAERRNFWCPCGYACTESEALCHKEGCLRATGMVFVSQTDWRPCDTFLQTPEDASAHL